MSHGKDTVGSGNGHVRSGKKWGEGFTNTRKEKQTKNANERKNKYKKVEYDSNKNTRFNIDGKMPYSPVMNHGHVDGYDDSYVSPGPPSFHRYPVYGQPPHMMPYGRMMPSQMSRYASASQPISSIPMGYCPVPAAAGSWPYPPAAVPLGSQGNAYGIMLYHIQIKLLPVSFLI